MLKTGIALLLVTAQISLALAAEPPSASVASTDSREDALYQKLIQTKEPLRFDKEGHFRILVFSDIHGNGEHLPDSIKNSIRTLVDRESPDLVLFDGDNTWGLKTEDVLRSCVGEMVSYLEEQKIPWAHVYGNHDDEGEALSRETQQAIYESFQHCVSKAGDKTVSGVGNYVLPVLRSDSDKIAFNVWALDSGTYLSSERKAQVMPVKHVYQGHKDSPYAYIKTDQILWYYQSSQLMEKKNGAKIPAMMFFHIPLQECYNAWVNRDGIEWKNEKNEEICGSELNSGMFTAALERGDIKAMVFGHDHVNDFMLNYCGIKLCGCSTVSPLAYWEQDMSGARVFIVDEKSGEIETHMSYLNERREEIDPQSVPVYEDALLLDFEQYFPPFSISSFDDNVSPEAHVDEILVALNEERGLNQGKALSLTRKAYYGDNTADNFEVKMTLKSPGRLGENKYLRLWMDLTGDTTALDFRKCNLGLIVNYAEGRSYCTDIWDAPCDFFYLAEGGNEWVTMSHGSDGCFGMEQDSSVKGFKGWFAFPIENMLQFTSKNALNKDSVITGIYFFGCLSESPMAGEHIYLDNISLVKDYKEFK